MSDEELRVLKTAIINEEEGEFFYTLTANQSSDEEMRQAFLFLAAEEHKHQDWLRKLAGQLASGKSLEAVAPGPDDWAKAGLFDRVKPRGEKGSFEVSAFHIGVMLEKEAIDFYTEAARRTALPEARQLYERLVSWETKHLQAFEQIYDHLKDEWWQQQQFSPA